MTIHDLSVVYDIGTSVFTRDKHVFLYRTWDTYEVTDLFSSDPELCFVAEHENAVIGFVLGTSISKPRSAWTYGYLVWTAVKAEYQRHKIGQQLYKEMERRARTLGARMMIIDTEGTNLRAVRFFESLGFKKGSAHVWMTKRIRARRRP